MFVRGIALGVLAAALMVVGAGCAKPGPIPTEGIVTFDKVPLENATVTFIPVGDEGQPAMGLTGTDGSFRLTTQRFGDGVRPGDYKVTVVVNKPTPQIQAHEGMSPQEVMGMYFKALKEMKDKPQKPLVQIPESYQTADKTPLRYQIPAEGKVILDLRKSGS
jgi:hypothetical protein